jgi:hypothetical protein
LGSLQFVGAAETMLLCDGLKCDEAFHSFCLAIPLQPIPDGDWLCPICIHQRVNDSWQLQVQQEKGISGVSKWSSLSHLPDT